MSPSRKNAVLYTLVVFVAGILAGLLAANVSVLAAPRTCWHDVLVEGKPAPPHVVERLCRRLELNDAQRAQLQTILDSTARQYSDVYSYYPRVRHEALDRIRAVLTHEQQQRFDAMIASAKKKSEAGSQKSE